MATKDKREEPTTSAMAAQEGTRDVEPVIHPVVRDAIRINAVGGKFISPVYSVLLSPLPDINDEDVVLTAICWLLKGRPDPVAVKVIILTAELQARERAASANPISDHTLAFIAMSGLMTLAKEVQLTEPGANHEYLRLKWKAFCATLNIGNIFEHRKCIIKNKIYMELMQTLVFWQIWIKSQGDLRKALLNMALRGTHQESFVKGVLDQVQFVLKDYGLESVYLMENFILLGNYLIKTFMCLPYIIIIQAENLKKALVDLRTQHRDKFPYLYIYPLEGADRLHHRNYPDLYYAAIRTAIRRGELGAERYITSMSDIQTTILKSTIEEAVEKTMILPLAMNK